MAHDAGRGEEDLPASLLRGVARLRGGLSLRTRLAVLVTLAGLDEAKRPSQLRLAGSNKILCEDFRREMGFGVDGHPCNDLAGKVRGR